MNERIEIVRNWIEKGDHDLGTGQLTYLYIPKFRDTIAFHCQQAVEKYLKGYLYFLELPINRTHDLNFLLSIISQKVVVDNEIFDKASELDDFGVEIRYPDAKIQLTNEDIERSLFISREFREFVLLKMNLKIDYDEIKKG